MTNFSFQQTPSYSVLKKIPVFVCILVFGFTVSYALSKLGILIGLTLLVLPFLFYFFYLLFTYPKFGLYSIVFMGFAANGLTRYVNAPLGLAIDALLVLTYLAIYFKKQKYDWSKAKNGLTYAAIIWMAYSFFEIFNPEARSFEAWFYAMRGVSLYMLLAIPLVFVLFDSEKDLDKFLHLWLTLSIFGTLIGMKQLLLGVDSFEQAWLDAGAAKQHILFGKLRVFSFYSDAGQFGAAQGHAMVLSMILFLGKNLSLKKKIFYLAAFFLSLYGMMVSGTRGAMAVPALGFMTYFLLSKNFKVFGAGVMVGAAVFVFLKFTKIAQGVYAVNRMRTALDPNDASLLVRLENQKKLSAYLTARPFGGGIGSAGSWGLRFSPNSFLAQTPTDSWFVKIWAEEGMIGLTIHLIILFYIAIKGGIMLWKMPDNALRQKLIAIFSGMIGIYMASYGNGILGQMPTGILMYMGWAFLFMKSKEVR
jgi:hypothetical protein